MSPFSCFSPSASYEQTLPRHYTPGANPVPASPASHSEFGTPLSSTPPSPSKGNQAGARKLKRASYGPGGILEKRAITKGMIGLPTNFVHEGHVGRPLSTQSKSLDLSTSIASALRAPNLSIETTPSFPTRDLASPRSPLGDSSNNATASNPANGAQKRKPPPPVTASVIRQAGIDVVEKTGGVGVTIPSDSVPIQAEITSPKSATTQQSSIIVPASIPQFKDGLVISNPDSHITSSTTSGSSDFSPQAQTLKASGRGGYMTGTAKKRWDGAMKEIEEALAGEGI